MKKESNKQRKNLYLGDSTDKISDALAFPSGKLSLPILKNGSTMSLMLIKIGKKLYSFGLTCGFASLLQIMLVAATYYSIIKNYFVNLSNANNFVKLVLDILDKGITAHSYESIGKLLLEYDQKSKTEVIRSKSNPQHIKCSTAINDLHLFIFNDIASFIQCISCKKAVVKTTIFILLTE